MGTGKDQQKYCTNQIYITLPIIFWKPDNEYKKFTRTKDKNPIHNYLKINFIKYKKNLNEGWKAYLKFEYH